MSWCLPSLATYTWLALRTTESRQLSSSSMCLARMNALGSMQSVPSTGFCSSGAPALPLAAPYHTGAVTSTAKTPRPRKIFPALYMGGLLLRRGRLGRLGLGAQRLLAEVDLALLLALHHHRVRDELGDAAHLHSRRPVVADVRERGAVDGAAGGEDVDVVLL